jgi:2-polyprenyl-6-methoxyphenol hydroxylase-like FAD-dependent oxidoreductase
MTLADPRSGSRGGLLFPLEDGRWILSAGGAHGDAPPGDAEGFMRFVQGLRTPTIHTALRDAERVGEIVRHAFPESRRRHFDRLASFPRGLLPMADSICRFNPIYGQGMSVAAQEACALREVLAQLSAEGGDALARLAPAFFAAAVPLVETPWAVATLDFVYPQTSGERPADFATTLAFGAALARVAARDPEVHRLMLEVQHLIKPRSAYREPAILQRIAAEMSAA